MSHYETIKKHEYENTDQLVLEKDFSHFAGYKPGEYLVIMYLENCGVDSEFNACHSEYFKVSDRELAIQAFDLRLNNGGFLPSGLGSKVSQIMEKE